MKGKYANAAERRREMEVLEARAVAAERDLDRERKAIDELRQHSATQISALKERGRVLEADRDQAQGPKVAALQAENDRLRSDLESEKSQREAIAKIQEKLMEGMVRWLKKATKCTGQEALEKISALIYGRGPTIAESGEFERIRRSALDEDAAAAQIRVLQATRNERHSTAAVMSPLDGD